MQFYKEKKVNPAGGCLPMIVQLIFLFALYRVFMLGLDSADSSNLLYNFVKNPGQLNPVAFGFFDLSKPNIVLAGITAVAQYFQGKMMLSKKTEIKPAQPKKDKNNKQPDFGTMMQQQITLNLKMKLKLKLDL